MRSEILADAQRGQQDAVGALSDALTAIELGKDAYVCSLSQRREYLAGALTNYQRFKHQRLYDPAISSPDVAKSGTAREMKVACIAMGQAYQAHLRDWPISRITEEWDAYRTAVRLAGARLRRQLLAEAARINALIDTGAL